MDWIDSARVKACRAVCVLALAAAPVLGFGRAAAQAGTDIYLARLTTEAGRVTVGEPVNATKRPGYDNQPYFTADGGVKSRERTVPPACCGSGSTKARMRSCSPPRTCSIRRC